ncbi:hypothetical protein RsTz2092_11120 [Deferribacterales bacterium RsTz2092]|nr:hypothetical protein AGMMS49941_09300 [Deferribacterales bacterium]
MPKSVKTKRLLSMGGIALLAVFIAASYIIAAPSQYTAQVSILKNDEFLPPITQDISQAASEIVCAIYMFKTDSRDKGFTKLLLDSMLDALKRGVKLYIIMDVSDDDSSSTKFNRETGAKLKRAGAEVRYDEPERMLHAKTCVIDGHISYIGSHNYTFSALQRNNELTTRIVSPDVAREVATYIKSIDGSDLVRHKKPDTKKPDNKKSAKKKNTKKNK